MVPVNAEQGQGRIPLQELREGDILDGTVRSHVSPGSVLVDVGCEAMALLVGDKEGVSKLHQGQALASLRVHVVDLERGYLRVWLPNLAEVVSDGKHVNPNKTLRNRGPGAPRKVILGCLAVGETMEGTVRWISKSGRSAHVDVGVGTLARLQGPPRKVSALQVGDRLADLVVKRVVVTRMELDVSFASDLHDVREGDVLDGQVVQRVSRGFLVDVGRSSLALLAGRGVFQLRPGEHVRGLRVEKADALMGRLDVSLPGLYRLVKGRGSDRIGLRRGDRVNGSILAHRGCNFVINIGHGWQAFLWDGAGAGPELEPGQRVEGLLVLSVSELRRSAVVSLPASQSNLSSLEVGDRVTGAVTKHVALGTMVAIAGVDRMGLLKEAEGSSQAAMEVGTVLEGLIVDRVDQKLGQLDVLLPRRPADSASPFSEAFVSGAASLSEGDVVNGTASRVAACGALVDVGSDVLALLRLPPNLVGAMSPGEALDGLRVDRADEGALDVSLPGLVELLEARRLGVTKRRVAKQLNNGSTVQGVVLPVPSKAGEILLDVGSSKMATLSGKLTAHHASKFRPGLLVSGLKVLSTDQDNILVKLPKKSLSRFLKASLLPLGSMKEGAVRDGTVVGRRFDAHVADIDIGCEKLGHLAATGEQLERLRSRELLKGLVVSAVDVRRGHLNLTLPGMDELLAQRQPEQKRPWRDRERSNQSVAERSPSGKKSRLPAAAAAEPMPCTSSDSTKPGMTADEAAAASTDDSAAEHPLYSEAHASHTLEVLGDILFCAVCGAYGVSRGKNILKPCSGSADAGGKRALARLRKGLPPKGAAPEAVEGTCSERGVSDVYLGTRHQPNSRVPFIE